MLENENIICISSIDWDFIWQGHQEIMSTFAKNGNRVLFIENMGVRRPGIKDIPRIKNRIKNWLRGVKGIRKEMDNLYIFSPLVLPFPYSRIARLVNRHLILHVLERWMKIMDFGDPIIWSFLPTSISIDIVDNFVKKIVVYHCVDNFSVSSASAKKIVKCEKEFLKKADLIFVTSRALYEYCKKHNDKVHIFPSAVDFEGFNKVRTGKTKGINEISDIKRPIIGYIGGIHKWIDKKLIQGLAESEPDYSFIFVGPIQTDISGLKRFKNIYFLGNRDRRELPLIVKDFDVGIIPYLITDYTRNVFPAKLSEYLAMGKPIVSVSLPEMVDFNKKYGDVISLADNKEEFAEQIKKSLSNDNEALVNRRVSIAKENSWKEKILEMSDLIIKEIKAKTLGRDARWKENLIVFYKKTRRKTFKVAAVTLLLYLLFLKTPIMWFLASPLKISDQPKKADVIVVFGGGVGETGSPGKSTIERARYASQLYQEHYADKIIFSSGYTYTYNDAENMKLFALSMSVLSKDIILEQKANSTYENVLYSKRIVDKNKWDSIILISSPYNMRRAQLVFNKWAKDTKVYYAPVKNPQFYHRGTHIINMEQLKAFMHEYIGIVYYWFKGYV